VRAGVGLGLPQGFNVLAEYRRYIALGQDSFAGGLEYAVRLSGVRSAWRFGWESDLGQGDPAGLTAGVGFGLSDYSLDYAYQSLGDLGMVQRLSLSWHLGGPGPGPKPDPAQMARLAREAYETGRYAESARIYTELADTPDRLNSSNMWSSAAMAWYKLGKRDQALACFRNAYALNPKRAVLEQWIHTLERR